MPLNERYQKEAQMRHAAAIGANKPLGDTELAFHNTTWATALEKHSSMVPTKTKALQEQLIELNNKLAHDMTRTVEARVVDLVAVADKRLTDVLITLASEEKAAKAKQQALMEKVESFSKIKDVHELMLASRYADLDQGDFAALVRTDPFAAKAALHDPVARAKHKVSEGLERIATMCLQRAAIGDDGINQLEACAQHVKAIEANAKHLSGVMDSLRARARNITATRVELGD